MKCLVGECKIEGSGEKCANGYAAYTDNKLDSVRGLSACLTLPVSHLLSAHLVMDKASKLAALQWEAETEKMSKRGWKKEKRVLLLTPSLKEPFTCVDTLEWLEGLSASWEKSWGEEEERNEKSNKSDWYSPPTVGQNARCNVNHDVPTVHPGPSWHYTTSCLRFTIWPIISSRGTGTEIDVYSEPVDIFQLHNQQMKCFNISQAPVTEPRII